jgi:hypothetical protein
MAIFDPVKMKQSRAQKARERRYRKPALAAMQRDFIDSELYDIANECSELEWAIDDDETLLDVFDGDADEIYEFRMMFEDLSTKCERLIDELQDARVTEHFDDFFSGALGRTYKLIGYDSVEEDYYNLTRFESELAQGVSGKRLMQLTKENIIAVAGQCIGIMMSVLDIRHSYDNLKATFDLLRDDRAELIKSVKTVEDAYQKTQADPYDYAARDAYDTLVGRLPARMWIE